MPTGTLTLRQLCPMRSSKSKRTVSSQSIVSADIEGQIDEPEVIVRDTPKRLVSTQKSIGVTSSVLAEGEDEAAKNLEEWQELRIAELRRLIVSPERSKEIQQRQPCADFGRPFYKAGQGSENGRCAPRIRIDRQIHKSWESKLSKFGLSLQQQKLQNIQDVVVPLPEVAVFGTDVAVERSWSSKCEICHARNCRDCVPALAALRYDRHGFERGPQTRLCENKIAWIDQAKKASLDFSDLVFTASYRSRERTRRSFAPVTIREHARKIPLWAKDDNHLKRLLGEMYPKWQTDSGHHKRAAMLLSVLYRYFRQLDHTQTIAEDLGLSHRTVEYLVAKARKAARQSGVALRCLHSP
jgi:hypothetical protein